MRLTQDKRLVEFYAKAPGQRTTIVHAENGYHHHLRRTRRLDCSPNLPVPVLPLTEEI